MWEVDLLGVDLVGVDFVRVDLVGLTRNGHDLTKLFTCSHDMLNQQKQGKAFSPGLVQYLDWTGLWTDWILD